MSKWALAAEVKRAFEAPVSRRWATPAQHTAAMCWYCESTQIAVCAVHYVQWQRHIAALDTVVAQAIDRQLTRK